MVLPKVNIDSKKVFLFITLCFFLPNLFQGLFLVGIVFVEGDVLAQTTDLVPMLVGANIIMNEGPSQLYDLSLQAQYEWEYVDLFVRDITVLPFRLLPIVGVFFVPFLSLGFNIAQDLFLIINLVLIVAAGFLLLGDKKLQVCLWVLFCISLFPIYQALYFAQLSVVTMFLFALFYRLTKTRKYFWSGVSMSLISMIKVLYLPAIPFLLIFSNDRLKTLKGLLVGSVLVLIINIVIYGNVSLLYEYPQFLLLSENPTMASISENMYTLVPFLNRFFQVSFIYAHIVNVILLVFTYWFVWRLKEKYSVPSERLYMLAIIASIFFAIHALKHEYSILAPFLFLNYLDLVKAKSFDLFRGSTLFFAFVFMSLSYFAHPLFRVFGTVVLMLLLVWDVYRVLSVPRKKAIQPTLFY